MDKDTEMRPEFAPIQTVLFDETDVNSRKKVSLHKVRRYDPQKQEVIGHTYHLIIIDMYMTLNVELTEATVINLINSAK